MTMDITASKDIPDSRFLSVVEEAATARGLSFAMRWDVVALFVGVPEKIVMAKASKMIRRGKLDGCTCGCRGDFSLPDAPQ